MKERLPLSYEKPKELIEFPKDPTNFIYWDAVYYHLFTNYPFHYYLPESIKNKIKRASKRKMFDYILKISKKVLTNKQYEAFILYHNFYPRKTSKDIAVILNINSATVRRRIQSSRFRIIRFFYENTKSSRVKMRLGIWLAKYREKRNKYNNKWAGRQEYLKQYYNEHPEKFRRRNGKRQKRKFFRSNNVSN